MCIQEPVRNNGGNNRGCLLDLFNLGSVMESIWDDACFTPATISFFRKPERDLVDETDTIAAILVAQTGMTFKDSKRHILDALEKRIIEKEGLKLPK